MYRKANGKPNFKAIKAELKEIIRKAKDVPCFDCGKKYPTWIMDFDHLRDKKYNISQIPRETLSKDILIEEISKCQCVCSNCHRNRTYLRENNRNK